MGEARITQEAIEVIVAPSTRNMRDTQVAVEVVVSPVYEHPCDHDWQVPIMDAYPTPGLMGGPQYLYFEEIEQEHRAFSQAFEDLHEDAAITASGIRRFAIEYEGLTQAEAKGLDDHYAEARTVFPFTITVPRTGEVVAGVRYEEKEGFKIPEPPKKWQQKRSVRLIKYPS